MDIWDSSKLVLFVAFVVPGFVSLKCYELLCAKPQKDAANQLIDALTYSCVNYAILFYFISLVEQSTLRSTSPHLYTVFYAFVLLIAPVIWASIFRFARSRQFLQKFIPHPISKPWDYVFSQRKELWVIVTMKNGHKYGGLYSHNSFSSSAPAEDQIYLEQCWKINEKGGLEDARKDTAGLLIVSQEIECIEFFNVIKQESANER
ncbi:DUF6338 family protein [Comamonas odontotermitis]|uniref:DUF6338 family protein n=1 Tax=Comamonas odontotermitis TaxID=379895 RepID=UPI00366B6048